MTMYDAISEDLSDPFDPKGIIIPGMRAMAWKGAFEFAACCPWQWDYSDEKVIKAARLVEQSGVEVWGWDFENGPLSPSHKSKTYDAEVLRILSLAREHTKAIFVPYALALGDLIYMKPEELPPGARGVTIPQPDGTIAFGPILMEIISGRFDSLIMRQLDYETKLAAVCKCTWVSRYQEHPEWFEMVNKYFEKYEGFLTQAEPRLPKFAWTSPHWTSAPDRPLMEPAKRDEYFALLDRLDYRRVSWGAWASWRAYAKELHRWA